MHYAKHGVYKSHDDISIITATEYSMNCFVNRVRIDFFLKFASYALMFFGIFHRQLWTYSASLSPNISSHWSISSIYVSSRVRILDPVASGIIVAVLEVLLIYGILLEIGYKIDWRDHIVQRRTWKRFMMEFFGASKGVKLSIFISIDVCGDDSTESNCCSSWIYISRR